MLLSNLSIICSIHICAVSGCSSRGAIVGCSCGCSSMGAVVVGAVVGVQ